MKKRASVVVPTYMRPALLEKCLQCLCRQTLPLNDFEIIIVSDGPDFRTREMLNHFHCPHPFIQFISLPFNQGPAAARNAGWKAATAPLVAFTDDDCLPDENWLKSFIEIYEKAGGPLLIAYTGRVMVPVPEEPTDFELNTAHLETADFITANCACTRAALEMTGGFDERFRVAWREDSDLEFRLINSNIPIIKVNDARIVHPVRKARWGMSIYEQKKTMFNALLYKKFPDLFRRKIQPRPAWNYYLIVAGFFIMLTGLIFQHHSFALAGALVYISFTTAFIIKRLLSTSKSPAHVIEMVVTSLIIPFSSVYWTLYGAFKYRVLFY